MNLCLLVKPSLSDVDVRFNCWNVQVLMIDRKLNLKKVTMKNIPTKALLGIVNRRLLRPE